MFSFQKDFIEFAITSHVLRFGEFTLKSGRVSPYFFNAGLFNTGKSLARLGQFYAAAIHESGIEFDTLFGPAYKGIPLVSAAAISLAERYDQEVPYCFNRKEAKRHGEGGNIVGAPLAGRVLIVDDVITAGTAVREAMHIIETAGARAAGVLIALDRQERGNGGRSAIQEVEETYGVQVISVAGLAELVTYLQEHPGMENQLRALRQYRREYGVD